MFFAQTFAGSGGVIPDDGNSVVFDIHVGALPNALNTTNFGVERVCINGGGPLENLVRSGVKRLADAHRPVVCGSYLDRDEAARLMAWADYLLIPSRIESIPVIFSDAMQARCRVITTPVGDLPALLQRYPVGIVAEQPSPAALAVALQRVLLNDPQYDQQLEAAQCAAAKEFSVQRNAERLVGHLGLGSEASTPC